MSLITVSSLSKSFGAEDLFSGVTFSVAKGARLAIVGPNGIGKTTLLRILIGQEEASGGTITRARNLRVGYLSQEADFELEGVLWDVCLEPFADLIRMQGELEKLEAEMSEPPRSGIRLWSDMESCSTSSSGWAGTRIPSRSSKS